MRSPLLCGSLFTLFAAVGQSTAAEFVEEKAERFSKWSAILYRNLNGNRLFCAAESHSGNTAFRIARYKDSGETFLEIYDGTWNMMEGNVRFSINFAVGTENYSAELAGRSWGDSYTHDFTDKDNYAALLGLISQAHAIEIKNPNSTTVATFSGSGADKAITSYTSCVEGSL